MITFKKFRDTLLNYVKLLETQGSAFYKLKVSKEGLWDAYINNIRKEDDPICTVNSTHNCNCCRSFIQRYGNLCIIQDNKVVSIWDFPVELEGLKPYDKSVEALRNLVSGVEIDTIFFTDLSQLGVKDNISQDKTSEKYGKRFSHFYLQTPVVCKAHNLNALGAGSLASKFMSTAGVVKRAFQEISLDSIETVLGLVNENNIARSTDIKESLELFKSVYTIWRNSENKDLAVYSLVEKYSRSISIRNTPVGQLLVNISSGMVLETAIFKYENMVDPSNFRKPRKIFTEKQRKTLSDKIVALGYQNSLACRHADIGDISVKDVIWVAEKSKDRLREDPLAVLVGKTTSKQISIPTDIKEVSLSDFQELIKGSSNVELLFQSELSDNLMNLLVQKDTFAPSIMQWGNPFRHTYSNNLTGVSNIKKETQLRGGNVNGVLNVRLAWNSTGKDRSDYDLWAEEPSRTLIGYNSGYIKDRGNARTSLSGQLDLDNTNPGSKMGIENITWTDTHDGVYRIWVNQYATRGAQDFVVEIETQKETIVVQCPAIKKSGLDLQIAAIVCRNGNYVIDVNPNLQWQKLSIDLWNKKVDSFQKVTCITKSPNYWGYDKGNLHYFFFIEGLKNPNKVRAIHNEFLVSDFYHDRRVFESLGEVLHVPFSENQMAGIGIQVNNRKKLTFKVDGRPYVVDMSIKESVINKPNFVNQ